MPLHPATGWHAGANSVPVDPDGYSVVTYTQYTPHRRNPERPPTPKRMRFAAPEAGPSSMEGPQVVGAVQMVNNRYAPLLQSGNEGDDVEGDDEEYELDSSDYDDSSSDEDPLTNPEHGLIPHDEIAYHLPRKTVPVPAGRGGKTKSTRPPKRAAAQAAGLGAVCGTTSKKRKRPSKKSKAVDDTRPSNAPTTAAPGPTSLQAMPSGGVASASECRPVKKRTRNPIYHFFKQVEANPKRPASSALDKHFQCLHAKPGEDEYKIVTITQKMNHSVSGLISYLRNNFPEMYALYETMKNRDGPPTAHELEIASGRVTVSDVRVGEYLHSLQQKADAAANYLQAHDKDFNQEHFVRLLAEWQVACDQPFDEVEKPEFQALLQYAHGMNRLAFPSQQTMKRRVMDLSASTLEETKAMIKGIKGKVSLALDAWTSSNGYAFLAIVMHYVNEDWELEELLIDFRELLGQHTGENMASAVWETIRSYDLASKIMAINCDNASNNDTMMEALEAYFEEAGIAFSATWARMRCMPHTVHLSALQLLEAIGAIPKGTACIYQESVTTPLGQDDDAALQNEADDQVDLSADIPSPAVVDSIKYAVEKLRRIVRAVRSSPQRRAIWLQLVQTLPEPVDQALTQIATDLGEIRRAQETLQSLTGNNKHEIAKMLILDVKTRWSSTHQMLQRALRYRDAIDMFVARIKDTALRALSEPEWEAIVLIEKWLRMFREATTHMSRSKSMTLSMVHAVFKTLQDHIQKAFVELPLSAPPSLKTGLLNAHTKLSDYYYKMDESPYYVWASLLDPRISLSGLLKDSAEDDDAIKHIRSCNEKLKVYLDQHYPVLTASSSSSDDMPTSTAPGRAQHGNMDSPTKLFMARYNDKSTDASNSRSELEDYLSLSPSTAHRLNVGPLRWWQMHEPRFPRLARLARDIFSIPGSAVSVERIFSSGRDTISLRRASLKPDTIRALMLLKQQLLLRRRSIATYLKGSTGP